MEPQQGEKQGRDADNRLGGRPPLDMGFRADCDATLGAWNGAHQYLYKQEISAKEQDSGCLW